VCRPVSTTTRPTCARTHWIASRCRATGRTDSRAPMESDPMSEQDSTFHASTPEREFVADPGLDEHGVAAMTVEEMKEYLMLLLKVLRPNLPSLAWLRQAASSRSGAPPIVEPEATCARPTSEGRRRARTTDEPIVLASCACQATLTLRSHRPCLDHRSRALGHLDGISERWSLSRTL